MKVIIDDMQQELDGSFSVFIGDTEYRIRESVDGKLCINKADLTVSAMMVFPRYSNEIEIL